MDEKYKADIIYIEDDQELIDLVSLILKQQGYLVRGAGGGQEGIKLILESQPKPDLILLDLMMPGMDGWEIFHFLKNRPDTAKIPVIIITAKSQPIDRVLGLQVAKVDDYISKPFRPHELVESIVRVLAGPSGDAPSEMTESGEIPA